MVPKPGVISVPRVPGAGVHPDAGRTDGVCGLEAGAELVDPLLPARRVDAVDGGRVRGERDDRDAFGVGDRGGLLRRPRVRRADGRRVVVLVDDFSGVETCRAEEAQRFCKVTVGGS
jgi:hypothetical protein